MLQHGDSITIFCNITDAWGRSGLKRISWLKNGVVQQSVRNPDADSPVTLVIKNAAARDGGNYSCELELRLRYIKAYNVSDSTMITSEYTISLFTIILFYHNWNGTMCRWNSCLLCWDRVDYIFHAWTNLQKIWPIWDVIGCTSGIPTRLIKYNNSNNNNILRIRIEM